MGLPLEGPRQKSASWKAEKKSVDFLGVRFHPPTLVPCTTDSDSLQNGPNHESFVYKNSCTFGCPRSVLDFVWYLEGGQEEWRVLFNNCIIFPKQIFYLKQTHHSRKWNAKHVCCTFSPPHKSSENQDLYQLLLSVHCLPCPAFPLQENKTWCCYNNSLVHASRNVQFSLSPSWINNSHGLTTDSYCFVSRDLLQRYYFFAILPTLQRKCNGLLQTLCIFLGETYAKLSQFPPTS